MPDSEAKRFRMLAAQAFAIAAEMTDLECRRQMLGIAACYERLAEHAEGREAPRPPTEGKE